MKSNFLSRSQKKQKQNKTIKITLSKLAREIAKD